VSTHITRILCPVDFSEFSIRALAHAVAWARWYEAELTALHVVLPETSGHRGPKGVSLMPQVRDRFLDSLSRALESVGASGLQVHAAVEQGEPARAILETGASIGADFIVIGTHGRSGIEGPILGSIAARVLWGATCPVLTIPRQTTEQSSSGAPPKTILCAIDFSSSSLGALDLALFLGETANGKVTVLHVVESFAEAVPRHDSHVNVPEYRLQLERNARARLRALVPEPARDRWGVEEVVAGSRAYQGILRAATTNAADLIVMGAPGHGGFDLMLFGSTTEHVLRQAPCPVLTVRVVN